MEATDCGDADGKSFLGRVSERGGGGSGRRCCKRITGAGEQVEPGVSGTGSILSWIHTRGESSRSLQRAEQDFSFPGRNVTAQEDEGKSERVQKLTADEAGGVCLVFEVWTHTGADSVLFQRTRHRVRFSLFYGLIEGKELPPCDSSRLESKPYLEGTR